MALEDVLVRVHGEPVHLRSRDCVGYSICQSICIIAPEVVVGAVSGLSHAFPLTTSSAFITAVVYTRSNYWLAGPTLTRYIFRNILGLLVTRMRDHHLVASGRIADNIEYDGGHWFCRCVYSHDGRR